MTGTYWTSSHCQTFNGWNISYFLKAMSGKMIQHIKALTAKAWRLSSVHMVKGKNQLPQIVLWTPYMLTHTHICIHIYKINKINVIISKPTVDTTMVINYDTLNYSVHWYTVFLGSMNMIVCQKMSEFFVCLVWFFRWAVIYSVLKNEVEICLVIKRSI